MDFIITVGEFEDDLENGAVRRYSLGFLDYDGNMRDGERSGKGIQYFPQSETPQYDGSWKKDTYDGQGTLYDQNGNVLYDGKWKYGDYA